MFRKLQFFRLLPYMTSVAMWSVPWGVIFNERFFVYSAIDCLLIATICQEKCLCLQQFDRVITALEAGQPIDLSKMPPPPPGFASKGETHGDGFTHWEQNKSMAQCKKDVTPLLMHWSYVFLALTHRNSLCFATIFISFSLSLTSKAWWSVLRFFRFESCGD